MTKASRPRSIRLFERFYLSGSGLSVVSVFTNYGQLREQTIANGGSGSAAAVVLVTALLGLLLNLALWYFIARRASNGFKWTLVALSLVALLLTIFNAINGALDSASATYLGLAALVMVLNWIGISFLFRADAVRWLSSNGAEGEVDPHIFS